MRSAILTLFLLLIYSTIIVINLSLILFTQTAAAAAAGLQGPIRVLPIYAHTHLLSSINPFIITIVSVL